MKRGSCRVSGDLGSSLDQPVLRPRAKSVLSLYLPLLTAPWSSSPGVCFLLYKARSWVIRVDQRKIPAHAVTGQGREYMAGIRRVEALLQHAPSDWSLADWPLRAWAVEAWEISVGLGSLRYSGWGVDGTLRREVGTVGFTFVLTCTCRIIRGCQPPMCAPFQRQFLLLSRPLTF